MKKILSIVLLSMLFAIPSTSLAYDKKCVIILKRSNGHFLKALLSKNDCKQVTSLKKGEKLELRETGINWDWYEYLETGAYPETGVKK